MLENRRDTRFEQLIRTGEIEKPPYGHWRASELLLTLRHMNPLAVVPNLTQPHPYAADPSELAIVLGEGHATVMQVYAELSDAVNTWHEGPNNRDYFIGSDAPVLIVPEYGELGFPLVAFNYDGSLALGVTMTINPLEADRPE